MLKKSLYMLGLIAALGLGLILGQTGLLTSSPANAAGSYTEIACPSVTLTRCQKDSAGNAKGYLIVSGANKVYVRYSVGQLYWR